MGRLWAGFFFFAPVADLAARFAGARATAVTARAGLRAGARPGFFACAGRLPLFFASGLIGVLRPASSSIPNSSPRSLPASAQAEADGQTIGGSTFALKMLPADCPDAAAIAELNCSEIRSIRASDRGWQKLRQIRYCLHTSANPHLFASRYYEGRERNTKRRPAPLAVQNGTRPCRRLRI